MQLYMYNVDKCDRIMPRPSIVNQIFMLPYKLTNLCDILRSVTSLILIRFVTLSSLRTLPGAFSITCLMPASDTLPHKKTNSGLIIPANDTKVYSFSRA